MHPRGRFLGFDGQKGDQVTRLIDRMWAGNLQSANMYDLLMALRKFPPREGEEARDLPEQTKRVLTDPNLEAFAREIRPLTGLQPAFYDQAVVVGAENVVRYVQETTSGREHGMAMLMLDGETIEVFATTSAITVLPPYPVMFVEATSVTSWLGITSFGWTIVRVDREDGGWEIQASLIVEWDKWHPVGPLFTLLWTLDEYGRFVHDTREGSQHPALPTMKVRYPTDPRQSDPELLERLCDPYIRGFNASLTTLALTLGFMNCKNVEQVAHEPPARLSRAHRKRRGQPLTRFTTLDIRPMKQTLNRDGRVRERGLAPAVHTCRGHFKTYRPESPLFGRLSGQFWWEAHERGAPDQGRVHKDYRVHSAGRPGQVGEVYRPAAAGHRGEENSESTGSATAAVDRAGAHDRLQDQLATTLAQAGLTVLRPAPHEPQFDVACQTGTDLWLFEVKSTTAHNEVTQVRTALGQVLHYREILAAATSAPIRCAIVVEHAPLDQSLVRTCQAQSIALIWPDIFPDFIARTTSTTSSTEQAAPSGLAQQHPALAPQTHPG